VLIGGAHLPEDSTPPLPAGGVATSEPSPTPPAGFRLVRYGGVPVAVPNDWGYGRAPREHSCDAAAAQPYVDLGYVQDGSNDQCIHPPVTPEVMHVVLSPATEPAPWRPSTSTWLVNSAVVAGVRVTVVHTEGQTALARDILNSARPG
jgi:hypothetical protein